MSQFLLFPVFFPFLAGPFAYWIGCWHEKARNTFVMSAAALELFLVLTLWTKPELAQATAVVEGFCGMGIQLRAGGFHTLMALLTATGWMAATVFCREYMVHVHKRNRFYLFWLMTLGATMGVFLSGDLFTAFLFFEVMSFTSFVLVIQTEEYPALKAGETYLAVAVIGGLAALTGLFLLYRQLGTLSLDAMAAAAAGAEDRGLLWVGGLLVLVGFLSQYLPWVLVSRLTFIYHYFASVPFIILATAQALRYLERHSRRASHGLAALLCAAAVILFIAFYPLASGLEVPRAWCDAMNWFDGWMWY